MFASEANPAVGQSIRQGIGPLFALSNAYLGDQWSVGDWEGLQRAIPRKLPLSMLRGIANMISAVKVPVLLTQHFHQVDEATGTLVGAMPELQARRAGELVTAAGQDFTFRAFPEMPHAMHLYQPALYTDLMVEWAKKLGLLG